MSVMTVPASPKPLDFVLFDKSDAGHPKLYIQNAGLDFNQDGLITKSEAATRVRTLLDKGLRPENASV